jgi:hypothetical protein
MVSNPAGNIVVNTVTPSPTLGVATSGGNSILSWPVASANYVLQQSPNLGASNWTDVSVAPTLMNQVTAPAPGSNLFYRLNAR